MVLTGAAIIAAMVLASESLPVSALFMGVIVLVSAALAGPQLRAIHAPPRSSLRMVA